MKRIKEDKVVYITILGLMISLACVLYYFESIFISPFLFLPGGKIGIANLVSLVAIYTLGIKEALIITVLRVIIVNIIMGRFLDISFYLGFFGGLVSNLFMGFFSKTSVSVINNSIIGAIIHNMTQLFIVAFFVFHKGILYYAPFLIIFGFLAGLFNGIVGGYLIKYIKNYLGGDL